MAVLFMPPDESAAKAVEKIFADHGPMVYRRALRLLSRHEDALEAMQEVFVRVLRKLPEFDQRSAIETWLYRITTNHCIDLIRVSARQRRAAALHAPPVTETEDVSVSDQVLLRQLFADADQEQAQAVVYVYMDGMSHEQAAELLGVSKRTVGNLIERFLSWAQRRSEPRPRAAGVDVADLRRGAA